MFKKSFCLQQRVTLKLPGASPTNLLLGPTSPTSVDLTFPIKHRLTASNLTTVRFKPSRPRQIPPVKVNFFLIQLKL